MKTPQTPNWMPLAAGALLCLTLLTGCQQKVERVFFNDRTYQLEPKTGCSSIETERGVFDLYVGPGNQVTTQDTGVCFKVRTAIQSQIDRWIKPQLQVVALQKSDDVTPSRLVLRYTGTCSIALTLMEYPNASGGTDSLATYGDSTDVFIDEGDLITLEDLHNEFLFNSGENTDWVSAMRDFDVYAWEDTGCPRWLVTLKDPYEDGP